MWFGHTPRAGFLEEGSSVPRDGGRKGCSGEGRPGCSSVVSRSLPGTGGLALPPAAPSASHHGFAGQLCTLVHGAQGQYRCLEHGHSTVQPFVLAVSKSLQREGASPFLPCPALLSFSSWCRVDRHEMEGMLLLSAPSLDPSAGQALGLLGSLLFPSHTTWPPAGPQPVFGDCGSIVLIRSGPEHLIPGPLLSLSCSGGF